MSKAVRVRIAVAAALLLACLGCAGDTIEDLNSIERPVVLIGSAYLWTYEISVRDGSGNLHVLRGDDFGGIRHGFSGGDTILFTPTIEGSVSDE